MRTAVARKNTPALIGALVATLVATLLTLPAPPARADHLEEQGLHIGPVGQIASGWMHSCAVTADGEAYCWGNDVTGNLGDVTAGAVRPVPKRVDGFDAPVTQISAGADHTCALTSLGDVWCWGSDMSGQLGTGTNTFGVQRTPRKVAADVRFTQVSAGNTFTCALTTTGVPWCWGSNSYGQLGRGPWSITDSGGPGPVYTTDLGTGVRRIVAGANHTCAISAGSELWCWGQNTQGQVGIGEAGPGIKTPTKVAAANGFTNSGVADVALGTYHTCATTGTRQVYCWGTDEYGRLGHAGDDSALPVRVTFPDREPSAGAPLVADRVSLGLDHSCAWTTAAVNQGDGLRYDTARAWCWGRGLWGQLGDKYVSPAMQHPELPVLHETLLMQPTGAVLEVASGYNHTCMANAGGLAHCFGLNAMGQNGDGTLVNNYRPARVFVPPL